MRSFKICGIRPQASKQASKQTYANVECSHTSVGPTQARPNNSFMYTVDEPKMLSITCVEGRWSEVHHVPICYVPLNPVLHSSMFFMLESTLLSSPLSDPSV